LENILIFYLRYPRGNHRVKRKNEVGQKSYKSRDKYLEIFKGAFTLGVKDS
jgi:hypothetical protein